MPSCSRLSLTNEVSSEHLIPPKHLLETSTPLMQIILVMLKPCQTTPNPLSPPGPNSFPFFVPSIHVSFYFCIFFFFLKFWLGCIPFYHQLCSCCQPLGSSTMAAANQFKSCAQVSTQSVITPILDLDQKFYLTYPYRNLKLKKKKTFSSREN